MRATSELNYQIIRFSAFACVTLVSSDVAFNNFFSHLWIHESRDETTILAVLIQRLVSVVEVSVGHWV